MASLHNLAMRGDPFDLLAALESGADPDEPGRRGQTPLMAAAKADNRVAVRLLLSWGADLSATDQDGRTALIDASTIEMRRLILGSGADPDRGRLGGMTLLAFFASFRDRSLIDLLISYGADPEEKTNMGRSVREMLQDPDTVWAPPFPMDGPENSRFRDEKILELSDHLRITPAAYVA